MDADWRVIEGENDIRRKVDKTWLSWFESVQASFLSRRSSSTSIPRRQRRLQDEVDVRRLRDAQSQLIA